jgi:hypothetical protein
MVEISTLPGEQSSLSASVTRHSCVHIREEGCLREVFKGLIKGQWTSMASLTIRILG